MSSSRISLHECILSIRLPILSHTTSKQTGDKIALHAAATPSLDHTQAYTGSTILLLLSITLPSTQPSPNTLIHDISDPLIYLVAPTTTNEETNNTNNKKSEMIRLPIMSESSWIPTQNNKVIIKSIWVLIRSPPEKFNLNLQGKYDIMLELRQKPSSSSNTTNINSAVSATIYRASKLFGRVSDVRIRKSILIVMPLEVHSEVILLGNSLDKPIVKITVSNITRDANIHITEPFFHMNSCRRISRRKNVTLIDPPNIHSGVAELHRLFRPVPLCTDNYENNNDGGGKDDERPDAFIIDGLTKKRIRGSEKKRKNDGINSEGIHGVSLPEFNPSATPVASLRPRDEFTFVFRLERKLQQQNTDKLTPSKTTNKSTSFIRTTTKYKGVHINRLKNQQTDDKKDVEGPNTDTAEIIDRLLCDMKNALSINDVIQTDISLAWTCSRSTDASIPNTSISLRRELSANGVLTTNGKISNIAIYKTLIEWKPIALLDGIVISITGSNSIHTGEKVFVNVSIANHTGFVLNHVRLLLDEDDCDLMPLRTRVGVGRIGIGDECAVRIECVALISGMVSLGKVCVVCDDDDGNSIRKWSGENGFKSLAVSTDVDIDDNMALLAIVGHTK